jgi:hypothetical protein
MKRLSTDSDSPFPQEQTYLSGLATLVE